MLPPEVSAELSARPLQRIELETRHMEDDPVLVELSFIFKHRNFHIIFSLEEYIKISLFYNFIFITRKKPHTSSK